MTRFGSHLKISLGHAQRVAAERLFVDTLGCERPPGPPGVTLLRFADGGVLGLFWIADADALTEAQHERSTWLEFVVADPVATARRLEAAGVERVRYGATDHAYFRIPGGPVFRLA